MMGSESAPLFPCGREGVLKLLPHRDPFVWVSRIVSCEPGEEIVAELDVARDLPLFEGHFPGHPVLPGEILMEALAQAACCCLMADEKAAGRIGYLAGIDRAKFRRTVEPGQTVTLEARITRSSSRLFCADVAAHVDGALCAEAKQTYVLAPAAAGER